MKPSLTFLTNSANGVGARTICEISARHHHHFRNPQARSRPSKHGIELKRRNDPAQAKSLDRWFSRTRTRLKRNRRSCGDCE
jgi:hypothetical protein